MLQFTSVSFKICSFTATNILERKTDILEEWKQKFWKTYTVSSKLNDLRIIIRLRKSELYVYNKNKQTNTQESFSFVLSRELFEISR